MDVVIKDTLESDFLRNRPPAVKTRLEACLTSDARNFRPGKRDPKSTDELAVIAIQEALGRIRSELQSDIPEITDAPGDYGSTTRKAVKAFKERHEIQRAGQALDDIVGRMTLTRIDDDLLAIDGKGKRAPSITKTQDIFIRIAGFDDPRQQGRRLSKAEDEFAEGINTPAYLEKHSPLECMFYIGGEKPDPRAEIVKRVQEMIDSAARVGPLGLVFVSGGSAGGRNTLEVVGDLRRKKVDITYVAVWDGAFQKVNLADPSQFDRPENFDPDKPATLRFKGLSEKLNEGAVADNFFQSWGHTLDKTQEIHGEVAGFSQFDLTDNRNVNTVKTRFNSSRKTNADKQRALEDAHTAAFKIGRDRADTRVLLRLLARPLI